MKYTDPIDGAATVTLLFVIAISAGLGAVWFIKGKNKAQQKASAPANERSARPYACVEIRCRGSACSSAKCLLNRRLLAATAPMLPLAGCDVENCTCSYRKWDDRRQENRRASDDGLGSLIFAGHEKRVSDERRDVDCDKAANDF